MLVDRAATPGHGGRPSRACETQVGLVLTQPASFAGRSDGTEFPMHVRSDLLKLLAGYVTDAGAMAAVERGEPLLETTALDSLALTSFLVHVEKEFEVRFELATLEQACATIDTLSAHVERARDA